MMLGMELIYASMFFRKVEVARFMKRASAFFEEVDDGLAVFCDPRFRKKLRLFRPDKDPIVPSTDAESVDIIRPYAFYSGTVMMS